MVDLSLHGGLTPPTGGESAVSTSVKGTDS